MLTHSPIPFGKSLRNILIYPKADQRRKPRKLSTDVSSSMLKLSFNTKPALKTATKSASLELPDTSYEISIRILSNYGDRETVTLSEIDILQENGLAVHDMVVSLENKLPSNNKQDFLCNNCIIKSSRDEMWEEKWDFVNNGPLVLKVQFKAYNPPKILRLFNSRVGGESNAKDVAIYVGDDFVVNGVVPIDFGVTLSLEKNSIPMIAVPQKETKPQEEERHFLLDEYGALPIPEVKDIELTVFSSLKNPDYVGLNCIEFFDEEGEPIPYSRVMSMEVIDGMNISSPYKLLKLVRRTMEMDDMWVAKKGSLPLTLKITFTEKMCVSMIRIWNFNGSEQSDSLGVRNAQIMINSKTKVWTGRVKRAKGTTSFITEGVTDIWLSEKSALKNKSKTIELVTSRKECAY